MTYVLKIMSRDGRSGGGGLWAATVAGRQGMIYDPVDVFEAPESGRPSFPDAWAGDELGPKS